jgi:hypothetical protein
MFYVTVCTPVLNARTTEVITAVDCNIFWIYFKETEVEPVSRIWLFSLSILQNIVDIISNKH